MEVMNRYLAEARKRGVDDAIVVETSKVYTAPWVRMKCQFGCIGYGTGLCCPPYTPDDQKTRAILDGYDYALLLHRHVDKNVGTGEDLKAQLKAQFKVGEEFRALAFDLERKLFLDGYYKAWSMGVGKCMKCRTCNITGGCVHPSSKRPSMESCGIDVYRTVRDQGLPIRVVRDQTEDWDVYALVLVQ
jgi:predicted metal-binding protein